MSSTRKTTPWRCRGSRYLFLSPWYHLRQDTVTLPAGEDINYSVIEHPGYALIVPVREDGCVLMERIYRYPFRRDMLECPSGGLGGQPPAEAASRELLEETGYRAAHFQALGEFACSSGISDEVCYIFAATGLSASGDTAREATEQIELEFYPLEELAELATAGKLEHAMSALGILLAQRYLSAN